MYAGSPLHKKPSECIAKSNDKSPAITAEQLANARPLAQAPSGKQQEHKRGMFLKENHLLTTVMSMIWEKFVHRQKLLLCCHRQQSLHPRTVPA